jgi:hypothetical protein
MLNRVPGDRMPDHIKIQFLTRNRVLTPFFFPTFVSSAVTAKKRRAGLSQLSCFASYSVSIKSILVSNHFVGTGTVPSSQRRERHRRNILV